MNKSNDLRLRSEKSQALGGLNNHIANSFIQIRETLTQRIRKTEMLVCCHTSSTVILE